MSVRFPGHRRSRFGLSSRGGVTVSSVVPSVGPSGVPGSCVSSCRLVARLVGRLVSSGRARFIRPHRRAVVFASSSGSIPVSFRRGYLVWRPVKAMTAVACFCFSLTPFVRPGAVFPSSVSRRRLAWIVPVPVAAWRGHPRSSCVLAQAHRLAFPVGPSRLLGWASRCSRRARCVARLVRMGVVSSLPYPYAPFLSARFPIGFSLRSSGAGRTD